MKEDKSRKESRFRGLVKYHRIKASLTVEAALVLPLFLLFMIAFLYFIQIFTVQEQIQAAITKMGLNLAKTAYVYDDFLAIKEAQSFDQTIFDMNYDIGLQELTSAVTEGSFLKLYVMNYVDINRMNHSCIQDGFNGISFFSSRVMDKEDCIDVVARYRIKIPIKLFGLEDMRMIQRVRLRSWTGYQVSANYSLEEAGEASNDSDNIVYITETGSVYHVDRNCSHIKLSITSVMGIPTTLRNDNGAKYYPCEACCNGQEGDFATYYITSDGTRYHTRNDCSKIKRTVIEVKLSEVSGKTPCKRCGK